jgi:hypothetical protein
MNQVGEKEYLRFQDPIGSAEHLFDQPGTGWTPHAFDLYGERERGRGGGLDADIQGSFRGTYIFFLPGNDAGLQTGLIDFRFPEICGHAFRAGGKDEKYLLASRATEMKEFFPLCMLYF